MANQQGTEGQSPAAAAASKPPAKPKAAAPASSQPRTYIVFEEITKAKPDGKDELALVEVGRVDAKTPKEARRLVAKAHYKQEQLTGEGVPLRAITASAAEAGRGIAKLKVEPSWDDS